jgi:transcription-repair coupling factor (superfamily II helicase)
VNEHALEPLPSLLPPEGSIARPLRDVVARLSRMRRGRLDLSGVRGGAASAVAAALVRSGRSVVLVTEDVETAGRAAQDLAFLARGVPGDAEDVGDGGVLVFSASESSPYADVSPDRRSAMNRAATLFRLARGSRCAVLVVSASALVRKVPPRARIAKSGTRIAVDSEIDRDGLLASLTEAGYLRVPIVEDPGSFAVRGALVDVWPASTSTPVRLELYGDAVLALKRFDAVDQKTLKEDGELTELWLPPAREAVLDKETVERARTRIRDLAEAIDFPTTRTRALAEDVAAGRTFLGAEGYLPAYYDRLEPLSTYFAYDALVLLEDPPAVTRAVLGEIDKASHALADRRRQGPCFPLDAFYLAEAEIEADLETRAVLPLHRTAVVGQTGAGLAKFESVVPVADGGAEGGSLELGAADHQDLDRAVKAARSSKGKHSALAPLVRRLSYWRDHGMRIFLTARARTQAERLAMLLEHQGVPSSTRLARFDPAWLDQGAASQTVQVVVGSLARGVVLPADGLVLVTEEEIFGSRVHRRRDREGSKDPARPFLQDLQSLHTGDLVVHTEHGVGRYLGLVHKEVAGITVDLICVEYGGGDKLYLPVWRLNQLEKYVGAEGASPKLDRLGGSTFARSKARVAGEVRKMADELLRLYAERQALARKGLAPADDDYRAFEATFPFDETDDQARAIDEVNRDLESQRPMDRLVCGDVGFGKTEVALRAAFRVATSGKQVAVLCPTTVLAQQHFRTFEARMTGYPIVIRALSRFQTTKEQADTMAGLKNGTVDIVVGTHRLLSKDVHFKDLGLLVVDEEQRFGVAHKERIKQLRTNVDVLTLTATPIPRTLQMAVTGLRDLSLIRTAPVDRRAVRTILTRWDTAVVKEAIERELTRGGQCFYVYNRVDHLYEKAQRLEELVPTARIGVTHGQMREAALEQAMLDFVDGRSDVLVSTAIVESGLDIPRANTMIIDRADLFGLAQLYQLRGRVGRSKERAYCYLVIPPPSAMNDEARSRVEALERHSDLGSGFQIASLDLELRGAGDLLGGEQSGNVASVGFDMFCRMLEEAVHELRGEHIVHDVDPELSVDVEALLPEVYVADVGVRLSLYKRLAGAQDEGHVADIAAEMEDRFGEPPEEARRLVKLMALKTELRRLRVLGCEATARAVKLHLRDDTPLDPEKIASLVRSSKGQWKLTPDMRLSRRVEPPATDGLASAEVALADLASRCKDD